MKHDGPYWLTADEWAGHLNDEGLWDPRCTVTTKRGTQCQFRLFGGQVYTPYNGSYYISQRDAATFHAGICPFHRKLQEGK